MERNTYIYTANGVIIATESGPVKGSKRAPYIKWLMGWTDGGGWTGASTISDAWDYATNSGKPSGCSWYAYGLLMAREQARGRALASNA